MKQYYMPVKEIEKLIWLQNFANKIGGYAAKYGIAAATVTDIQNGYAWLAYWMNYRNQYKEFLKKLSAYKDEIIAGNNIASTPPLPPTLPVAPTSVAPGIFTRVTSLVNMMKANLVYTVADGNDLGIEGAEVAARGGDIQPQISVRLVNGGHPEIVWTKGSFDGIDIYVNRGNTGWAFLATDTYPNYIDTAALPASGQTALWQYKAIYRSDDDQEGQYSNPVSITVVGV